MFDTKFKLLLIHTSRGCCLWSVSRLDEAGKPVSFIACISRDMSLAKTYIFQFGSCLVLLLQPHREPSSTFDAYCLIFWQKTGHEKTILASKLVFLLIFAFFSVFYKCLQINNIQFLRFLPSCQKGTLTKNSLENFRSNNRDDLINSPFCTCHSTVLTLSMLDFLTDRAVFWDSQHDFRLF